MCMIVMIVMWNPIWRAKTGSSNNFGCIIGFHIIPKDKTMVLKVADTIEHQLMANMKGDHAESNMAPRNRK